jgi:hypothetical protein
MAGWLNWLIWLAMLYMVTCYEGWLSRLAMLCWITLLFGMSLFGYAVYSSRLWLLSCLAVLAVMEKYAVYTACFFWLCWLSMLPILVDYTGNSSV